MPILRTIPRLPAVLRSTSALAVLTLGGCTTGGVTSKPAATIDVPTYWTQLSSDQADRDDAALAQWWRQFDDPVLDELVTSALDTSPDIRTALARIEESRARHGVQRATLAPSVSASASTGGSRTTDRASDHTTKSESAAASLDASWEIDLFGKNSRTLAATAADLAETEEDFHNAQASLAAEVATVYVSLRSAEAQIAVLERNLSSREETAQLTQWREQAGLGDALDTQQAISTLEQARASLPLLQETIAHARNQLTLLSGKTPGTLDQLLATNGKLPTAPTALAVGIPGETLQQRPDIRAAARAVEAAAARISSAERERLPTLSLSGSIGVEALRAGRLFSPESTIASAIGELTAPIFDAGRIGQTIRIQGALEKQAIIAYESTVLTALSEVENALVSVDRSAERIRIVEKAVTAAREAATLARQQYEAGTVDLLNVLDAERTLLNLEDQQVTTGADHATAYIQLYKALGGGWSQS